MWYLEAYDNETEKLAKEYVLHGMTGSIIKELIPVDESEFPVEIGVNMVPLERLAAFSKYIEGPLDVQQSCEYFVGFYSD